MLARQILIILGLLAVTLPAQAGRLLDLEIVNRDTGQVLATYRHRGHTYVAGNPGERYAVRLVNRTGGRLLAVLSVDGVNAVSGETAAPDQSGYVLEPHGSAEIVGWRKSLDDVAQFYFTRLTDSYAARTDRPDHVGVIGVAIFREKVQPQPLWSFRQSAPAASAAAAAGASRADAVGEAKAKREADRLGTGHGEREYAPTRYTDFERAGPSPNQIVSIRYDSRPNLVRLGVIPAPRPRLPAPNPFPGQFVPDPQG
ncbi:MAG: hypothetical protein NHG36_10345 [Chromatiaceae bacterium]|nr:hypothetical protein [Candidatus Thioaporhodococcus sediminis]